MGETTTRTVHRETGFGGETYQVSIPKNNFPEHAYTYAYYIARIGKEGLEHAFLIGGDRVLSDNTPIHKLEGFFVSPTPLEDPKEICFPITKMTRFAEGKGGRFYRF
tara:strand:+ start:1127 stop:1447 length:321 start_codon:yes stop_codon:yes gene_type:complete